MWKNAIPLSPSNRVIYHLESHIEEQALFKSYA